MSVEIVVADPNAHSGLFHAIVADRDSAQDTLFPKGSVVVVHEQKTWSGIAGDKNICPTILVQIRGDHRHSIALGCACDPCLLAHVGKSSITIVSVQRMPSCRK